MLLKASQIKYISLPEEKNLSEDNYSNEPTIIEDLSENHFEEDIIIGNTVIIGGDKIEFSESSEEFSKETEDIHTQEKTVESEDDLYSKLENIIRETNFFDGNKIYLSQEPVVISNEIYEKIEKQEKQEKKDFDKSSDKEVTKEEEIKEEKIESELEEKLEEEVEEESEEEALIKQFESGFSSTDVDAGEQADEWVSQKGESLMENIDDKVKFLMSMQKDNIASRETKLFSIPELEREQILSESIKYIVSSTDPSAFEEVIANITQHVSNLAETYREEILYELEEHREHIFMEVEEHLENTIEDQRVLMLDEAQTFIKESVKEFENRLLGDNEFVRAATNIINQKEQILKEANEKSAQMIEEAEAEASRIMEEAYSVQEQADSVLKNAELQAANIIQQAQDESERIISEANIESARIIESAEQSHQEIVEAATQDGFNVGYQEGREEAIKENAQLLMETTNALNKLQAAFPKAVQQNEDKLIKLALETASAVVTEEILARPEIILKTVERAVNRVSDLERVVIKINPLDLDIVLPKQEYFRSKLPDVEEFIITGHYSITRGGCLIETNSGNIDARIETQLAVVQEVFMKVRSEYDYEEEEGSKEGEG